MATLDDIAKELGVSKSTVSKALSGAKDVSKAMRQTVLEKAVELGYSRAIRGAELPKIAVFITNMEYAKPEDFGYDLVVGFRKVAEPAGYHVDIIPLDQQLQRDIPYDTYMMRAPTPARASASTQKPPTPPMPKTAIFAAASLFKGSSPTSRRVRMN